MSDDLLQDYDDFEDDVGLGEGDKKYFGQRDEWLKMTKNQVLRVAFLYFHTYDVNAVAKAIRTAREEGKTLSKEERQTVGKAALEARAKELEKSLDQLTPADRLDFGQVHFKKMNAHYEEGLGYVMSRLGKDGADADAVWKKLQDPKLYFTALLLIYPTDREGNLDTDGIKAGKWSILPWRFSKKTYENIWKTNETLRGNDLSIANQDLKLECSDEKFQNITVTAVGKAIWQKSDKFKATILEQALPLYDKLIPFREMSTDQLRAKLGLGGSAVSDVSSDEDFTDLLDSV